jgi:predicted metal-binding membrane protein
MRAFVADRGPRPAPARWLVPAAVPATVVVAWAGLLLAELRDLPIGHDALAGGSVPLAAALGIFGVAWAAMVVAMMLPSSYPVVRALAATIAEPRERILRVAPFLVGYLIVWTLFGFALFAADIGIHAVVDSSPAPGAAHATLTGDALLIAGAHQLTERKRRCLSRCRHAAKPRAAPAEPRAAAAAPGGAWDAPAEPRAAVAKPRAVDGPAGAALDAPTAASGAAFRVGLAHGLDCLGSGWALMLAVFALASPQVVWMALFAGVMAYEKVGRHGVLVARLAGLALLVASVLAALS